MNKELQNKLFEKHPKIFAQKDMDKTVTLMCWGVSCGDGWFNIIDTLCLEIQSHIDTPHKNVELYKKFLTESLKNRDEERITLWTDKLKEAEESIVPQVEAVQVKEKFGTLRFYTNHYDETINAFLSFAESMSSCTCEECGAPGTPDPGGWIKTRCDTCRGE